MSAKPAKTAPKNSVHFTLQGKGGVGKSLVSSLLAQYFQSIEGCTVKCVDTDPVNQTLANYKALNAQHVQLMNGSKINERNFDQLMERLMTEDGVFVVDNGASSFVPLSNYLIENNAISMLQEAGREVFIHSVLTGGQALMDTLAGFKILAEQADTRNMVIWLNEYFGAIEANGKTFTEMKVYTDNADKVRGIVRIPERNQDTFGKDMELMASKKLTFAEVLSGTDFALMAKQRMKTVQRDLNDQLAAVGFLVNKRQLIAALVEKSGIKLTEDDPAFLLVDLNLLVLESRTSEAAKQLEAATEKFNAVTTRNVDDFVSVANEALSKFMQRTNEIKSSLDSLATKPVQAPTVAASASPPESPKSSPRGALLWWLLPLVFALGVLLGVGMAFAVLK